MHIYAIRLKKEDLCSLAFVCFKIVSIDILLSCLCFKNLKILMYLCQTCLNIWLRESDTQVFCFSVEYKFRLFLI